MTRPVFGQTLSTEQFHASVHALAPRVAVFDCDGTLWSGDSGSGFMRWTIEQGLLSQQAIDWINGRYQGYCHGEVNEIAICGEMVQVYEGIREDELRRTAREYFSRCVEQNIFPEMRALVADLQAKGVDIWAVSSTNDWVVEEAMTRFGIAPDRVLAARVEIANGVATGTLRDVPSDEGKAAALARVGITTPDAVFGNSIHDAAMLAIARQAYAVNPTEALLAQCARERWPVYYPASVRHL
ncbi:MAG: haloacid dehalogenase-like hydrolase [Acidobacteriaceae bacterium]|nr:haloacid dehalogenase-like hydrolase [Acidobacteriaceae bacterium]